MTMDIADIEPVDRESTAGIIAHRLREVIMNGSLTPGTQLGEAELARRFNVSRGPLREAMQRLVSEGLLRSERYRGLFVIELEPGDVRDIYAARSAIERAAVLEVMSGDRDRAAAMLDETVWAMVAAAEDNDPTALSDTDLRFHEVLIAASGSKRLARMARVLLIETRMCLAQLQSTYRRVDERVAEHDRITQAIRDGDTPAVLTLLEDHMEDAVQRLAPGTTLRG